MIRRLLCNGKVDPIGVDRSKIKLSVETQGETVERVSFKIYEGKGALDKNALIAVESEDLFAVIDGSGLKERSVYFWRAELFTEKGTVVSDPAFFETGISSFSAAKWIRDPSFCGYVSEYKKDFTINGKVDKARLFIVGLGAYVSEINGKKTDGFYFKPLLTDFDKRSGLHNIDYDEKNFDNDNKTVCYDAFNVTDLIKEGDNELKVLLGTGYYYDTDKTLTDPKFYFDKPKLIFELYLAQGGKETVIASDTDCLCRATEKKSQIFDCDSEDFTLEKGGYYNAAYAKAPTGRLVSYACERDAVKEIVAPEEITLFGRKVYDFKKNHSGSLFLKVKGEKGGRLTVKYYEFYDERGLNSLSGSCLLFNEKGKPVGMVSQTDSFVLSGDTDTISPLFSWKCYRFVTLDCDCDFTVIDIKSLFICSAMEHDGEFTCSDGFIQRFYDAYILTQYDNLHCGVSSDCPHREKLPYTGDGCLTIDPVMYNFDCENFYDKWLDDIIAAQGNNGWIPYSAPYMGGGGGYFWCNVITVLPLKLYYRFGNAEYLKRSVKAVKKYIDYCVSMLNDNDLIDRTCTRWLLGEWLTPSHTEIDVTFFNTLAFYAALSNAEKISDILGENGRYYKRLKDRIKDAINKNYFDAVALKYDKGKQGEDLFALSLGIVPEKYEKRLFGKVVDHYRKEPCFDTGIIITPVLLDYLTNNGEQDLAYEIFTYKGVPSFYAMLENETTLCEHWNKKWPDLLYDSDGNIVENFSDVSHCHAMFGSVVAWMYRRIAGLDLSEFCDKKITVRPEFIPKIKSAGAKKATAYGTASVEYKNDGGFIMHIEVPFGCTAEVYIKESDAGNLFLDGKELKKSEGYYRATLKGGKYEIKENES
ncbi:MAG: family 78 glycoside hydrolase catalytic domain [Clostridia bacterium]|nr:family 78 glycoside hydrolase catalytic domain [Clostridia bacterium]